MFVDGYSRWMKLYGMRRKSDTLAFVKKFIADMSGTGVPRSFRMDNGGAATSLLSATTPVSTVPTRRRAPRSRMGWRRVRSGE